uniref:OSK domain-containing protein n=1 Tax=Sander lucioperca TaxID=283035 RepID=A0A8C9XI99_SANLU
MPPFSVEDYYKLLQKIVILETKLQRLEVNLEVNGSCGNDTTLLLTQNNGQKHANTRLTSTCKTTDKQEGCGISNKSTSDSPPWNSFGAKPKSKSFSWKGRLTGRAQHPEICDMNGWPALPSRQSASSTPVLSRTQPWTAAKGRISNKMPPQQLSVQLDNRFAPLLQDPGHDLDCVSSSHSRVRTESNSKSKKLQGKLTTGHQTLIVGDSAVKDIKSSKNTKILCFPKDMVSDLAQRIPDIMAAHPTVKNIILHIGSHDVVKQQSEVLNRDFMNLLNTVSSLNAEVFISGPIPPVRIGAERFSRLLALNKWLSTACTVHSLRFIDNFNIFWDRRHLFKADGLFLNKPGVKLFTSSLHYFLHHTSAPSAKDTGQDKSTQTKQEEDTTKCGSDPPQPPPEQRFDHGGPQSGDEKSQPPSPVQHSSNPRTITDAFEDPSLSPFTLSPVSPCHMLGFTDRMEQLVDAGTKFTPLHSPITRPQHQPLKVKRQAPLPPQGRQLTPSQQTDKYACVQNETSFN